MTQTASMILNELSISEELKSKIDFVKSSKLNFKDFNSFKILMNSLENFEPSSRLSKETIKTQINKKINHILEQLDGFIQNINENLKENSALVSQENSYKEKFSKLLIKLDEFSHNEKADLNKEEFQALLEEINELLTKDLNKNENEFLLKIKEEVIRYGELFEIKDLPSLSFYEEHKENLIQILLKNEKLLQSFASSSKDNFKIDFEENMKKIVNDIEQIMTDLNIEKNEDAIKFYEKYFNDENYREKLNEEMYLKFISLMETTKEMDIKEPLEDKEIQNTSLFENEELEPSFDANKIESYDEIINKRLRKKGKV